MDLVSFFQYFFQFAEIRFNALQNEKKEFHRVGLSDFNVELKLSCKAARFTYPTTAVHDALNSAASEFFAVNSSHEERVTTFNL